MPGFHVRTFGCKQNQFDSELLRRRMMDHGAIPAPSLEFADQIILNSCAVTQRAISKARGEIGRLRRLNPRARISVLGCGARYHRQSFIGADDIAQLLVPGAAAEECTPERELREPHGIIPAGRTRGFLRIQSGCDEACAYCIVPQLRGSSRSVPITACLSAQADLLSQGALEIVLTGTNIALWGRDLSGWLGLQDLLKALVQHIGPARLRLSSLEAPLLTPEFLDWCLQQSKICRHFHIALQSASSRVLEKMNRGALPLSLTDYLEGIVENQPDVCLGADIIAGLPGETEQDFHQTLDWIQKAQLAYLHVFPFSEREGTAAAGMDAAVAMQERMQRATALRRLGQNLKTEFISRNRHRPVEVIGLHQRQDGYWLGLATNYLHLALAPNFKAQSGCIQLPPSHEQVISIQLQAVS